MTGASATPSQFATTLLGAVGAPVTSSNVQAIVGWAQAEGGLSHNNPLNTTENAPGATDFNSVGVKTYPDIQTGVSATARTLQNGDYGSILSALKAGNDAGAVARAIGSSPWGTSGSLVAQTIAQASGAGAGTGVSQAPAAKASVSAAPSYTTTVTPGTTTTIVNAAPPALQSDVVLAQPAPDYVWLAGYWTWHNNNGYRWVAGHWELPPRPGSLWVAPRWEQQGNAYRYYEGYWT